MTLTKEQNTVRMREWREKNHERNLMNQRNWRKENPEKEAEYQRKSHRKYYYGVTEAQYQSLLSEQNGVCAICGGIDEPSLSVDHNHATGKVRGLLCSHCNHGLGKAKENIETLRNMIAYLEKHNQVVDASLT